MLIPAILWIASYAIVMQRYSLYYLTPMFIIGKIYANSMLALINSRMLLGSEETPSTIISTLKFATVPANNKDSTIEARNRDVALDTNARVGPSGSSEEALGTQSGWDMQAEFQPTDTNFEPCRKDGLPRTKPVNNCVSAYGQ
jgi:hypothetical protein